MKRPTSVTILGQRVTIEYTKDYPAKNTHALFDPESFRILIHDTVYYDKFLMHEIVHAIFYVSGLTHMLDEQLEEAICTAFEHSFFGLYKRNF